MRLVVFGANGRTGREIVTQALAAGHEVTAFVRDPGKAPGPRPGLRVLAGEVTSDQAAVRGAVDGQEAVLTAFGSPTTWHGVVSPTLTVQAVPLIVRAMRDAGVSRIVHLSAHGVGDTAAQAPAVYWAVYKALGRMFADKDAGERILRDSGLDWTFVYPVMLVNGPRTGTYRVGEELRLGRVPRISRADVADFMLRETTQRAYLRTTVQLAR
ncbi:NAD(P)H-binding protein [Streptomyces sp. NBC_01476]|uniref:NAD(P)-dependent oxidoreductase n=1 Tax=Streptomyces sp. NBC_01476 TaxID=2903881 RepID=UPI002E2FBC0B|nr:NAD(P)H-binding protein [Streptomyces sp. NBC_01476]